MAQSIKRKKEIRAMRNKILESAGELFLEQGYDHTTIRKIAEAVECNPATIYNYFKNKEELFFSLQERAFTRFYEEFEDMRASTLSGLEKLKKMGRKYLNFALKNPKHYELMFISKDPMQAAEILDPKWKIGEQNYSLLKQVIQECIEEKTTRLTDVESGAFLVWATVHGMVSLIIMDRCKMIQEENVEFILRDAYTKFEDLLESKL